MQYTGRSKIQGGAGYREEQDTGRSRMQEDHDMGSSRIQEGTGFREEENIGRSRM